MQGETNSQPNEIFDTRNVAGIVKTFVDNYSSGIVFVVRVSSTLRLVTKVLGYSCKVVLWSFVEFKISKVKVYHFPYDAHSLHVDRCIVKYIDNIYLYLRDNSCCVIF